MPRMLVLVVVVLLLAAPPFAAIAQPAMPAASPAGADAVPIWAPCPDAPPGFECAALAVPLDYADPAGATVDLALARLPAGDPAQRIGVLLVNVGGPGSSARGALFESTGVLFADEVRARFDLVGVDPRGVGGSTPLDCGVDLAASYAVDPSPDDAHERAAWIEDARRIAAACSANAGPLLSQIGTENVVEDLERVRRALGEEKISFLGFSYGTSIGARYADRYPERVRAFVLDAAVPPTLAGDRFLLGLAVARERGFEAFLDDCAASRACPFRAGGDPGAAFDALMARLDANPLVVDGTDRARTVGQGEVLAAIGLTLPNLALWPELANALAATAAGDGSRVLAFADVQRERRADGTYAQGALLFPAVLCLDHAFPRGVAALAALQAKVAAAAPRTGGGIGTRLAPCAFWPAPPQPLAAPPDAAGAPPLLVVGGTLDTQTPYHWAVDLAAVLAPAVLVTREGSGHVSLRFSRCVEDAVNAYLVDLTPALPGLVCPSTGGIVDRLFASGASPLASVAAPVAATPAP